MPLTLKLIAAAIFFYAVYRDIYAGGRMKYVAREATQYCNQLSLPTF